jgi:predicted HicB family RNase H-like nuclease
MVDTETHKALVELAAREDVSIAYLVANILKAFVDLGINQMLEAESK